MKKRLPAFGAYLILAVITLMLVMECIKSTAPVQEQAYPSVAAAQEEYPVISYSGYYVVYNPEYKLPRYVQYELVASETEGESTRTGLNFRKDPSAKVAQAEDSDYRNSGWSRGHMAPAGDFKWSDKAMEETFYFTNCCPQNQALNAGQWSTLEKKVRGWAKRFGSVTVATGPLVWENTYGTIGANEVVVPDAFFKAILAGDRYIIRIEGTVKHGSLSALADTGGNPFARVDGFERFTDGMKVVGTVFCGQIFPISLFWSGFKEITIFHENHVRIEHS